MGKRSDFKRRPQDAYDTPVDAVRPLIGHLPSMVTFWEPCAGNGQLSDAVYDLSGNRVRSTLETDIEPRRRGILMLDALQSSAIIADGCDYIITNPPWTRSILHPMIEHFSDMCPTWLLFDADWMHTKQATPYLWRLQKIVSVGRVKWIPDSPHTGKDNCCWYLFDAKNTGQARFFGRT